MTYLGNSPSIVKFLTKLQVGCSLGLFLPGVFRIVFPVFKETWEAFFWESLVGGIALEDVAVAEHPGIVLFDEIIGELSFEIVAAILVTFRSRARQINTRSA